jgi:hypothetical protein
VIAEIIPDVDCGTFSRGGGVASGEASMARNNTRSSFVPMIIAMAVALTGFVTLLLIDHGLWNTLNVKNETMIQYGSAAAAAAAVGAVVTPTAPR